MNVDQFLTDKGYDLESVGLSELKELFEAYASSRLAEVSAQRDALTLEHGCNASLEIVALKKMLATLRAELERLKGPVCVISDSNYETGQTLWREWFEGGDRKPPEIPADTSLMLTWIVAKFRAELARLTGEREQGKDLADELTRQRDKMLSQRNTYAAALSQAQQALRRQAEQACLYWVRDGDDGYGHMTFREEDVQQCIEKWLATEARL